MASPYTYTGTAQAAPIVPHDLPHLPGTLPDRAPLDLFRTAVCVHINRALPELPIEKIYDGVDTFKKEGDFTVAMARFRLGGKPDIWAEKVATAFQPDKYISKVTRSGGFLYFDADRSTFARRVLDTIDREVHINSFEKPRYGTNESGGGKLALIEFSAPNIAKQFHIGHLRSTIIGQFLVNLYQANGWKTLATNYLGDWGKQFGLIAVGFERYGSDEALEKDAIKHLYEVYVKINKDAEADETVHDAARAYFKRMEDGDESSLKQWKIWREQSIVKYRDEYARLNVSFDLYLGESTVTKESQAGALERLDRMKLMVYKNGAGELVTEKPEEPSAKVVDLRKWKLEAPVLVKKDGTSIYLTRDIGGAIERAEKYKFDEMIYVVASQQDLHLQQFFKMLSLLEYPWASNLKHVNFGMVQGMSTRKGTVVFLDDIIREASDVMHEQMKKNEDKYSAVEDPVGTSQELGITAIKIQDMSAKRINNYTFDWKRMTSFEGDTGPYLQYAHVRLSSIARKNPELLPLPAASSINTSLLTEPKAHEILMYLAAYPDVVATGMTKLEPSGIVTFCFKLSHAISAAWEILNVKTEEDKEKAKARLWLFLSAKDVLGAAMKLLSLTPLERM